MPDSLGQERLRGEQSTREQLRFQLRCLVFQAGWAELLGALRDLRDEVDRYGHPTTRSVVRQLFMAIAQEDVIGQLKVLERSIAESQAACLALQRTVQAMGRSGWGHERKRDGRDGEWRA